MPSTDTVSSITNCYRLIVSNTDPVHSFIISKRTVEPTGSCSTKKWSFWAAEEEDWGCPHLQHSTAISKRGWQLFSHTWFVIDLACVLSHSVAFLFSFLSSATSWSKDQANNQHNREFLSGMPPTHANFRSQSGLWEITEQANSNSHIYEVWGTVTTKPKPNFQLECLLRDELWSHHNPFLEYLFTWNSWNSITHWACHSFNLNTSPIWLNCSYHGSQSHYSADKLICWELPLLTFHPK